MAEALGVIGPIFQAGTGFAASAQQAAAMRAKGQYQKAQYDLNAELEMFQAEDAIKRGDISANQEQQGVAKAVGSQTAALGASGVSVGSGSAASVVSDTQTTGAKSVLNIRNNAWREAWGYRVQANQDIASGKFAEAAGNMGADTTLLTGGVRAAGDLFKGLK